MNAAERQIEIEHEQRKDQINQFFANLRNKVENEQRAKEAEEQKKEIKNMLRDATVNEEMDSMAELQITPFKDFAARLENENE